MTREAAALRLLRPADQPFLEKMSYEALRGSFADIPLLEDPAVSDIVAENCDGWGRPGDGGRVALDDEGEMTGAAWYRVYPDRYRVLGESRSFRPVLTIAVREENRGQGYGRLLLEGLMGHAAAQGVRRLNLSVALHNTAARQLYDSVGFTEVKRHMAHFGSELVPAVKMSAPTTGPHK